MYLGLKSVRISKKLTVNDSFDLKEEKDQETQREERQLVDRPLLASSVLLNFSIS